MAQKNEAAGARAVAARTDMKQWLKRIPAAYAVNSYLKDVALSRQAQLVERWYRPKIAVLASAWDERDSAHMLRARMRASGVRCPNRFCTPHIFCIGTYYDHEAAGFLQSLERVGRLSVFRNADGTYGLNPLKGMAPAQARESHARCVLEQVTALHREHPVSFLIGTMTAQNLPVEALEKVRAIGIPVVNIAMDDRLPEHWASYGGLRLGAIGLVNGVDLTLNTTREYVSRYLSEGGPAIHWPFGSDPDLFRPAAQKDLDVVFVGNNYGKRAGLMRAIVAAGISIHAYGTGFPNGHIQGERVPELFGRAKIVLGTGLVGHSSRVTTLKLRDFDGPMSGSLYLTSDNPDLAEHYDIGSEIAVYRNPSDCVAKLRYYLQNDAERERIAAAGRMRAVRDHTWDARISKIFDLFSA